MTLTDQELHDLALHGSRLGSALALVELCDRKGVEPREVLSGPEDAG